MYASANHQLLMGHNQIKPTFLNKYFARSTWVIFKFPSLNATYEITQRSFLTDNNR